MRKPETSSRPPSLIRPHRMQRDKELGISTLTEGLAEELRRLIVAGQLARGERMPASRVVAEDLGVSRNTVVGAYAQLTAEGYLTSRQGSGTFVERRLPEDFHPASRRAERAGEAAPAIARRAATALDLNPAWTRSDQLALSPGIPALDLFPKEAFARIAERYWRSARLRDLGHAGDDDAMRAQIARYLSHARGFPCDAEQVIVVASTLQAYNLIAHVLCDDGDGVLIEDPGHATAAATLAAAGLRLRPEAVDREGVDVARLSEAGRAARLAVLAPAGQHPFGSTMSEGRRALLARWALGHRVWLVEDDFNSENRWEGAPLPPLAAGPAAERTIYVSSFNRVLAPGLRLAYLVAPPPLVPAFKGMKEILSCHAPLTHQHFIASFMESGQFAAHLRQMRRVYQERSQALAGALNQRLRMVFEAPPVEVGLHMTAFARMPLDDVRLSALLRRRRIDAPPLSSYCFERRDLSGLVLGFGNTPAQQMDSLVRRIADALIELEETA